MATICNINDKINNNDFIEEEEEERNPDTKDLDTEELDETGNVTIFRFKFTEEFMAELYSFSKIHQYDARKDFKEAWELWTEANSDIIESEEQRLLRLGYDGDTLDKMFKSARYYFRKKSPIKVDPKKRRPYINVTHDILTAMDTHITNNIGTADYQPKNGFVSFCIKNETLLKQTISKIFEQGIKDAATIQEKLKKTYKNRYFLITNKK
jgi:hypothetical protein